MGVKPGYKQTEVGVIPEDWDFTLLDNVGKRGSGHTPNKKSPEYWNGNIKWISLKDSEFLDNVYIYDTVAKISQKGLDNSSAVLHPKGTVVLSRDAGVGKSSIMMDVMAVSQHFLAWHCGLQLNNLYLYYWLQSKKQEFERIAMGSTIKTIGLPYFKSLKLPLPKIEEQTAIATALSDVDALISGLDRLIEKKRAIKQAAMQELLTGKRRLPGFDLGKGYKQTEVGEIPEDWEITSLGVVIKKSQYGLSVVCNTNGKYPILRMNNLKGGYIDLNNLLFTNISVNDYNNYLLNKGDILFNRTNSIDLVGKTSIVRKEKNLVFASYLIRLIVDNSIANPFFINILLNKNSIQRTIKNLATKAVSQSNVNVNNLKRIVIHIPSLPEQTAIATVLSDMDAEISALETRRAKTISLKQGMMQELLTGRIRLV
nr:restriction endonuclease subunit S [uncultured Methanospirillum sp.]